MKTQQEETDTLRFNFMESVPKELLEEGKLGTKFLKHYLLNTPNSDIYSFIRIIETARQNITLTKELVQLIECAKSIQERTRVPPTIQERTRVPPTIEERTRVPPTIEERITAAQLTALEQRRGGSFFPQNVVTAPEAQTTTINNARK